MNQLPVHTGNGKLQPQDVEMEESVLGNCLLHPHVAEQVADILRPTSFYKPHNQVVFEAVLKLITDAEPVDILSVTNYLKKNGKLEDAGGAYHVSTLTNKAKRVSSTEYHCRILEQLRMKRELGEVCYRVTEATFDDTVEIFDIHELLDTRISQIMDVSTAKEFSMADLVIQVRERADRATGETGLTGITTGLSGPDRIYGGRQEGNLIISAGRPGMGKTGKVVSESIATAIAGFPVAIFSCEMPSVELAQRFVSQLSGVSLTKIIRGGMSADDWERVEKANAILEKLPIYIFDDIFESTAITTKIRVLVRKKGVKKVFIDHLGWIQLSGHKGNKNEKVEQITMGLKKCAKQVNIPIILLSQLNRAVETRGGDKRPMLSDLRDSGCLKGDTIIMSNGGLNQIEEISGTEGISLYGYHDGENHTMKAKKCWETKISTVTELTLSTGHSIQATLNHKFLTDNGWKPLGDIGIGDRVAIPLNFADTGISDYSGDIAYLMGAMIANGKMHKRQAITYTCNIEDEVLAEHIKNIISNEFECVARIENNLPKYNWINVYAKSKRVPSRKYRNPMIVFMEGQGIYDKRAKNKTLPESIFWQSKKNQLELLAGLFDNDGCINFNPKGSRVSTNISYSSASKTLIDQVQVLLQMNGVVSRIKMLQRGSHVWYNLYVSDKASKIVFCERIPLRSERKCIQIELISKRMEVINAGWTEIEYNDNNSLVFVRIKSKSVVDGVFPVYDIEVPESRNFVANGILVHNSIEQDADVVEFLYRPEYYNITQYEDGSSTEGIAEIIIAKNRNGGVGTEKVSFIANLTKFTDLGSEYVEPEPAIKPSEDFEDARLPYKDDGEFDIDQAFNQ